MKYEVEIPEKVEIDISDGLISVRGEKGELKREFNLGKMTNLFIALYERVLNA